MNTERRKDIERAKSLIEEAKSILETAALEEHEEFDDLDEKGQASDKGQTIEAVAETLDETLDGCDAIVSKLQDASV